MRKPKALKTKSIYAGIENGNDWGRTMVYVGGPYYQDSAQLHLTEAKDIEKLGKYLLKAAAHLKTKR